MLFSGVPGLRFFRPKPAVPGLEIPGFQGSKVTVTDPGAPLDWGLGTAASSPGTDRSVCC